MLDRGKYAAARNAGQGPVGYASSTQSRVRNIQNASPAYEPAYVTLAKIHLSAGRHAEGMNVLERLLQRNPTHPLGLELLREYRGR